MFIIAKNNTTTRVLVMVLVYFLYLGFKLTIYEKLLLSDRISTNLSY